MIAIAENTRKGRRWRRRIYIYIYSLTGEKPGAEVPSS